MWVNSHGSSWECHSQSCVYHSLRACVTVFLEIDMLVLVMARLGAVLRLDGNETH